MEESQSFTPGKDRILHVWVACGVVVLTGLYLLGLAGQGYRACFFPALHCKLHGLRSKPLEP